MRIAMEAIRAQLEASCRLSSTFDAIIRDYNSCLKRKREYEVRCGQLEKESTELRAETETLGTTLDTLKKRGVESEEYEEMKKRVGNLQEELIKVYKEKETLVGEKRAVNEQLEVVRDTCSRQIVEIERLNRTLSELENEKNCTQNELNKVKAAQEMTSKELQERMKSEDNAVMRAVALEEENKDLVQRIIHLKDCEADRMNEMNRLREEIIRDAKIQAKEIVAQALAKANDIDTEGGTNVDYVVRESLDSTKPKAIKSFHPKVHQGGCTSLRFDPSGSMLASSGLDKLCRVWDPTTFKEKMVLRGAHETVNDIAFTADSRLILGAEDHQAVRIWDVKSARLINMALTGHMGKVTGVSTFPSDAMQAASCATDRSIKLWKLDRGICSRTIPFTSTAKRIQVISDSGVIASGHFDGKLRLWDTRSKGTQAAQDIDAHGGKEICGISYNTTSFVIATVGRDNSVSVIDSRKFSVLGRLTSPSFQADALCQPALSPLSEFVTAGSKDGTLLIWKIRKDELKTVDSFRHPKSAAREQQDASITATAWSPAGIPVASSDRLGSVIFWA